MKVSRHLDRPRALFLALFGAVYLALDGGAVFDTTAYLFGRSDTLQPGRFALLYLGAYGFGLAAWVGLHAHAFAPLRWLSYALSWLTVATYLSFAQINEQGFSITQAQLVWEEIEFAGDALGFFVGTWLPPALGFAALVAAFEWSLGRRMRRIRSRLVPVAAVIAAVVFYQMLDRSDARLEQFPVPYRVSMLIAYAYGHQVVWLGEREAPAVQPADEPLAPHVVFIVDESIRGDWLGVNGSPFETTPYLSSQPPGFFNYGVASATANLSAPANILLQSGLRPDQLPDLERRSMTNPNLFAWFRQAGFATFLIDAQHTLGRPPNFMTDADVAALDGNLLVRAGRGDDAALEEWQADLRIIPELVRIVRENDRSFSYVLKIGAHFPYSVRFPPDERHFDDAPLEDAYDARRAQVVREYLEVLRFGVDGFVERLAAALDATGRDVVVLYTADHAQSLFEPWRGRRVRGHGHSPGPPPYQARVPLFLMAFGDAPRARLAALYHAELRDRTSAFEIFPTLLRLAGYAKSDLQPRYYHSLFDRDADRSRRVFVSGNHFGADGPLYRNAPYRSSFELNDFDAGDPDANDAGPR